MIERMTKVEAARFARFRAGVILDSVLGSWDPEDLREEIGEDGVERVAEAIHEISDRLQASGRTLTEIKEERAFKKATGRNRRAR